MKPKLHDDTRKDKMVYVRLSRPEKDLIKRIAAEQKRYVSDYIRAALFERVRADTVQS